MHSRRIGSSRGGQCGKDVDIDSAKTRQEPAARQNVSGTPDGNRNDGDADACCDRKCSCVEFADPGPLDERAFGKEGERLPGVRSFDQSSRIHSASVAIEPVHELRTDAPQQQSREGYFRNFFLDDEAEAGGEERFEYNAIDIARVIRDDDARRSGELILAQDTHTNTCGMEETLRGVMSNRTTGIDAKPWDERDEDERDRSKKKKSENGIDAVNHVCESQ